MRSQFDVTLLVRLRTLATTALAIVTGVVTTIRRAEPPSAVTLVPGDAAPEFVLAGTDGREYRLSQFRGRQPVIIAWFPKAFTTGCTAQCESIGLSSRMLRGFDVAYFGASVDSVATNRAFAASLGIDFPILCDPEKRAARAFGVLTPSGFAARWTFYIDVDGRILAIDKHVRTGSHGADIAAALAALKISRQA